MSAIGRITASAGVRSAPQRHDTPASAPLTISESRALVAAQPVPRAQRFGRQRPDAAFLAHLIATREQLPQTRARRRGEPEEAAGAYANAMAAAGMGAGAVLSRSM